MRRLDIRALTHSYPVLIGQGLLPQLLEDLEEHYPAARLALSDANLLRCQRPWIETLLDQGQCPTHSISPGEYSKNLSSLNALLDRMHREKLERNSPLVAFGGGVVGDLAGLAASLWQRGCPLLQVPTSLLAMVDSSIGGKTAINFKGLKNLLGTFWPPRAVYIDIDLLTTLPRNQRICGFAEMLKMAWICDPDWAAELEARVEDILQLKGPTIEDSIERSLKFKTAIVEEDERETGRRALLNLGHTFGHAFEALAGGELLHGQAVLFGIKAEVMAARRLKLCDRLLARRMLLRLEALENQLDLCLPDACRDREGLLEKMLADKKRVAGRPVMALPRRVGEVRLVSLLDQKELEAIIDQFLEEGASG